MASRVRSRMSSRLSRVVLVSVVAAAALGGIAAAAPAPPGVERVRVIGGSEYDYPLAVEADRLGNTYVGGWTSSPDYPQKGGLGLEPGPPFELPDNIYYQQGFVAKYSPAGELIYSTVIPLDLEVQAVTVDPEGGVYFAGRQVDHTPSGTPDVAILKLAPSGDSVEYSTAIDSDGYDYVGALETDSSGRLFVGGQTDGRAFPTTPGAYRTAPPSGRQNAFVARLDPAGELTYGTYLGGAGTDRIKDLALAPDGTLLIGGDSTSLDFGPHPGFRNRGGGSGFVARLAAGGAGLDYASFFGGARQDMVTAVAPASGNDALVTGLTATDVPPGESPPGSQEGGFGDVRYARVSSDGRQILESARVGGDNVDRGFSIQEAPGGAVLISGTTGAQNFPNRVNSPRDQAAAFAVRLERDGRLTHSTVYSADAQVEAEGAAAIGDGLVHVGGWTDADQLPGAEPGAGEIDGFLASLRLRAWSAPAAAIDGPKVLASPQQRQRGKRITVKLRAGAGEPVRAKAFGFAKAETGKGIRKLPMRGDQVAVGAEERETLKLRFRNRSGDRLVRRTVRRGRRVVVKATVKMSDADGGKAVERRMIRLR